MMKNSTQRGAFTLIELSIVLIVIGLLAGGSAKLFTTLAKRAKQTQTLNAMSEVMQTIQGYAQVYAKLPTQEVLEHMTLHTKDAWNKPFIYVYDEVLTHERALCRQTSTRLQLKNETNEVNNYAFALISGGKNRNIQTGIEDKKQLVVTSSAVMQESDLYPKDVLRVEGYDDIVKALPLMYLRVTAACKETK